ncbi:MAG: PspC domain-containing protein [Patescibacteria group bacterium]
MPARDINKKIIFGVCSGLSAYYNIDVVILRLIFLIGFLFMGITIVFYIVLALIMPKEEDQNTSGNIEDSLIRILKERLARGEITKEQFEDMRNTLNSKS